MTEVKLFIVLVQYINLAMSVRFKVSIYHELSNDIVTLSDLFTISNNNGKS